MKFLVAAFALVALTSAQHDPSGHARILAQTRETHADGSYKYAYETENGISADQVGVFEHAGPHEPPALQVAGGYQYTAPDGQVIKVRYTAGQQGFVQDTEGPNPIGPFHPVDLPRPVPYHIQPVKPVYIGGPIVTPKPYYAPLPTTVRPIYKSGFPHQTYRQTPHSFYKAAGHY